MRITVTIDDPSDAAKDELLAWIDRHAAKVEVDAEWTLERAERYYRELPPRAARILREAVRRGGYVPAEDLREEGKGLQGHSRGLTTTLVKGVSAGWWPNGTNPPMDYIGPGYGQVRGYQLRDDVKDVFARAIIKATPEGDE
ncbi:hypothetical protein ACFCXK_31885 [Streptomyces sp. NPDC056269]|uniref:hypothetical protein n=1 Tax=Streptomyces sp. NPDC056269 TaxID=3345768 RepID=UPI0035D7251C